MDGPLDYRDSQPVYLSEFELEKFVDEQKEEDSNERITKNEPLMDDFNDQLNLETKEVPISPLPAETYFPKPTTKSPNYQDPFYIHTENDRFGIKGSFGGLSNEYIYQKEKSARKDSRISADDFRYR